VTRRIPLTEVVAATGTTERSSDIAWPSRSCTRSTETACDDRCHTDCRSSGRSSPRTCAPGTAGTQSLRSRRGSSWVGVPLGSPALGRALSPAAVAVFWRQEQKPPNSN